MEKISISQFAAGIRRSLAPIYGEGEAAAMVRLIFHSLKGWDQTALIVNGEREVSHWLREKVEEILERLRRHEPLQYILGEARFYGMDFVVNRNVLIPRPETVELVDLIVDDNPRADLRVLDIGTGSGAIAIALSRNLKFPQVEALDVSAAALEVARENGKRLHANVKWIEADIFTYMPKPDSLDIIVSNPPYIANSERREMDSNVVDYEPASALFVPDDDPLIFYSRIAEVASAGLCHGGRLYFEINSRFGDDMTRMLTHEGFTDIRILSDSYGRTRFATAILP